jgi:hypothetical protein
VPYEVGVSRYRELVRGQIAGDSYGMLKLIVNSEDRSVLGVHVFGTNATELVHVGQAVMGCGGTVDYLVDTVFNFPTFSEAYKVAALDVTNKLRQVARRPATRWAAGILSWDALMPRALERPWSEQRLTTGSERPGTVLQNHPSRRCS